MDKKMMAAVEQAFQQRFGMDAGWAHNVLFISGECYCSWTSLALGLHTVCCKLLLSSACELDAGRDRVCCPRSLLLQ